MSVRALTLPIGQTILVNTLSSEVSRHHLDISPQNVIHAGATNLKSLTTDGAVLLALQACYSQAVTNVLYFALAAIALGMPFAIFMEWKTLKEPQVEGNDGGEHSELEKLAEATTSTEVTKS